MKKISFGSFPLVDVDPQDRQCVDNYSIKSFADLITMNTQMTQSASDAEQYITPDVILKYFKSPTSLDNAKNPDIKEKAKTMKNAFRNLRNYSKALAGNPFYKDKVTYPIYIEHKNKNDSHDYDFVLLANDLIQKESLDEIKYNDVTTLTFLFLKDMLYSEIKLSEMGDSGESYKIRSDIAKFIEFSKNNNTDPISAMIKLIKIASVRKFNNDPGYGGLRSQVKDKKSALNNAISKKFFKLFGGDRKEGQIKDINFMLNELDHLKIADFFDDTNENNRNAHMQGSNNKYTVDSTVERQYIAQKTHEYNKILSIVDSLIHFNTSKEVFGDVSGQVIDQTIKMNNNGPEIDVNYDKIIDAIRNDYFESMLITLITKLNVAQDKVGNILSTNKMTKKPVSSNVQERISHYELEIISLDSEYMELENIIPNNSNEQLNVSSKMNHNRATYNTQVSLLKQARDEAMIANLNSRELENKKKGQQSKLKYNIGTIQGDLTAMLNDIERSIYDEKKIEKLFRVIAIGKRSNIDEDELKKLLIEFGFNYNIEQLKANIFESMKDTVLELEISKQEGNIFDPTAASTYIDKQSDEIEKMIEETIWKQLIVLYKRLGRDFATDGVAKLQAYSNLRVEKNVIVRKTVTQSNNFKTYILSSDVLLNLYKILNHVDTQKYISGLIALPPTKINNELNIMKYMLNRLGLGDNPVFIISNQDVILSQPDMLSLTGSAIFSKIGLHQLRDICHIDYHKLLWNNNQMFSKYESTKSSQAQSEALTKVTELDAIIKKLQTEATMANNRVRELNKEKPTNGRTQDDIDADRLYANRAKDVADKRVNSRVEMQQNAAKEFNTQSKQHSTDVRHVHNPYETSTYTPDVDKDASNNDKANKITQFKLGGYQKNNGNNNNRNGNNNNRNGNNNNRNGNNNNRDRYRK